MLTIAHRWTDAVFLHWRVAARDVAGLLPAGTRPDVVDGSAWVGVTAYRFERTTVPPLPFPGRLGAMTQITVEVPTTDRHDHHAAAFLTVETQHVPGVVLARAGIGAPYRFARVGLRAEDGHLSYRSRRAARGVGAEAGSTPIGMSIDPDVGPPGSTPDVGPPGSTLDVGPSGSLREPGVELAHRDGIHLRHLGRTAWWRRTQGPWALRPAEEVVASGTLPSSLGLPDLVDRPPDSAVVGDRTDVTYAWGGTT